MRVVCEDGTVYIYVRRDMGEGMYVRVYLRRDVCEEGCM